jgi:hypothetical protein
MNAMELQFSVQAVIFLITEKLIKSILLLPNASVGMVFLQYPIRNIVQVKQINYLFI